MGDSRQTKDRCFVCREVPTCTTEEQADEHLCIFLGFLAAYALGVVYTGTSRDYKFKRACLRSAPSILPKP